ncbi:MAG: nucleotide-binding protein [Lentisphaeria bacterium]|nr:nucleotide-binding protein [Lentisphaeria bacterium]
MRKQNVIVFSSFKSLEAARNLAGCLNNFSDIDVVCWDDYFKSVYGEKYSERKSYPLFRFLTKRVPSFDFAVVLAGRDDTVIKNEYAIRQNGRLNDDAAQKAETVYAGMRDNVIFELGMCCMALGESRVILLQQENVRLFADLRGLNDDQQKKCGDDNKYHSTELTIDNIQLKAFEYSDDRNITAVVPNIVKYIEEKSNDYAPVVVGASCSTAQGYLSNFIDSLEKGFKACLAHESDDILHVPGLSPEHVREIRRIEIHVLVPNLKACKTEKAILSDAKAASGKLYNSRDCNIITSCTIRVPEQRPVSFAGKLKGSTLLVIDVPTTIQSSYKTAEAILHIKDDSSFGKGDYDRYISKELSMFNSTLRKILDDRDYKKDVFIDEFSLDADDDRTNLPWLYE